MKIIDVKIDKQFIDGETYLVCKVSPESGEPFHGHALWINQRGLWASTNEARDPAEVAAQLRSFADAIERYVEQAKAA